MKSYALIPGTPAAGNAKMKTLYAGKEKGGRKHILPHPLA